ncbi:hypothetical protein [Kitasatospora cheerisanensis]|uniref:Phage protein Gp19/Gp15/Gp42 n=1 Tax=Kitasatospora cheerisanensis KCTC 2395 TaxID=1348663 RepID=A0A066Z2H8_9ACTN|nr:hypothetical protein [Kitasatospora cheerisanensis]KDN84380.1 hypothetical protein KCH_41710 [Kitasatospora cheerisanensis KCTC 2395]
MTATVAQVKALCPQGTPLTDEQIEALIVQAEAYLFGLHPDVLARVAAGTLAQETVDYVEASMVARIARNPEGLRMEMDGDYQYQLAAAAASGYLTLLPDEERMLTRGKGAFTITPYNPRATTVVGGDPSWW